MFTVWALHLLVVINSGISGFGMAQLAHGTERATKQSLKRNGPLNVKTIEQSLKRNGPLAAQGLEQILKRKGLLDNDIIEIVCT